jgi:hypothetical protein
VCNDGNGCTQTDTCLTGACSNPPAANGTSCIDGNACTQTDTCQAGTCTGSNPVTCAASDQCHVAGTCDPSTGACSNPAVADGTACNDGNACTRTDSCHAGACIGNNPVTCAASDQCHVAGTCDPSTGACSNPAAADGTVCNDGNGCTQTDTCLTGACVGSNPVTCTAIDPCHAAGTCDPASGACSNPTVPIPDVTGLTVQGGSSTSLSWNAIGAAAQYDVAQGALSQLAIDGGTNSALCLASPLPLPAATDAGSDPGPGTGRYYLVRVRYSCGLGSYGNGSNGAPRVAPNACP